MKKKKVLVPTDRSVFSQRILAQIPRWFHPDEVDITLFCVADEPKEGTGVYADLMRDSMDRSLISGRYGAQEVEYSRHPVYTSQIEAGIVANTQAELLRDVRLLEADGFTVSSEVKFGNPADQIVDHIERHDIDLIAMTTHGRTGLKRLFMGSVAENVLTRVSIPVFLLRPFG